MSLLDLSNLSSLLQSVVTLYSLIHADSRKNNVTYSTLHLVAESLSLVELLGLDQVLNVRCELSQVNLTRSGLDSEETLDTKADYSEEQSQDQTYYETSLINGTQQVSGMTSAVATNEVVGVTHNEVPNTVTSSCAN